MGFSAHLRPEDLDYWSEGPKMILIFLGITFVRILVNFAVFRRRGPVRGAVPTSSDRIMEEIWLCTVSSGLVVWAWVVFLRNRVGCTIFNTHPCIRGWPNISTTRELDNFLQIEIGWYVHQLSREFFGVGIPMESDLFVHHLATLGLLILSLAKNLRILGLLILAVFNMSSPFMHFAKVAYYLNMRRARYVLFGVFALIFFCTRVVMLPFTILKCIMVDALHEDLEQFGWYYYFSGNAVMHAMYVLQIFWMFKIVKVLWRGKTGSTPRKTNGKTTPFQTGDNINGEGLGQHPADTDPSLKKSTWAVCFIGTWMFWVDWCLMWLIPRNWCFSVSVDIHCPE